MLRYSLPLLLAACTAAVPNGAPSASESVVEAATECVLPRALATQSSPFFDALATWRLDDFEHACALAQVSDERGTEHAACVVMALSYASGDGVARSPKKALEYLTRGTTCSLGFGGHDLSVARYQGIFGRFASCCGGSSCAHGCESECAAATTHVRDVVEPALDEACAANHASACFMLGNLAGGDYIQHVGQLTTKAERDRNTLFEKACALGLGPACETRGWLTPTNADDDADAARMPWFEKGCAAGWGHSCLYRAESLPVADAFPWWGKACDDGLDVVCRDLDEIP